MNIIRAHLRAVIISVLLLLIILLAGAFYLQETGKIATVIADTKGPGQDMQAAVIPLTAAPVSASNLTVAVSVNGKTTMVNTPCTTVSDVLKAANIPFNKGDMVTPGLDETLSNGAVVTVTRFSYQDEVIRIVTDYETEYVPDDELYEGEYEVIREGTQGVKVNTYRNTYQDEKWYSKALLSSVQTSQVQKKIVSYGTKESEPEEENEQVQKQAEADYSEPVRQEETLKVEEQRQESKSEEPKEEPKEEPEELKAEPEETEPTEEVSLEPAVTLSAAEYQSYAYSLFPSYGWSDDDYNALVNLWNRESGWNPRAGNSYGAYGIPQALPGNKMASSGSDWETNGCTQIQWGLSYIYTRYGNPSAAWTHFQNNHWY